MFNEKYIYGIVAHLSLLCVVLLLSAMPLTAQVQSGKASYYSKKMTGARTANGERLHHDSLTCAHKTYPFGTLLKVTNLTNGLEVVVRVTDRGPYRKGRIVDLSWGAAKAIGMLSQGIAAVRVEKLRSSAIPFKPEDEEEDLPLIEFEIADIADGIVPVWQEQRPVINQQKVNQQMKKAADKNAERPIVYGPAKSEAIEQINSQPNRSKAYLKRQSNPTPTERVPVGR